MNSPRRKRGGRGASQFPASLTASRKPHGKVSLRGVRATFPIFRPGEILMVAMAYGKLNSRELEAGRRAIRRAIAKAGRLFVPAYPHLPQTKKPLQVRMGKGKGSKVSDWVCPIHPGQVIYRLLVNNPQPFLPHFARGAAKLSIPVRVVTGGLIYRRP